MDSIGIYTTELDVSQYAQLGSSLLPGVVIYSPWGPYNTLTDITSVAELVDTFGKASSSAFVGLIGVKKYLRFGSTIKVVRAASVSDVYATKTLNDGTAQPSVILQALYKGSRGNDISVIVTSGSTSGKKLLVYVDAVLTETFDNLVKSAGADKNANWKSAINGVSLWITVKTDGSADANTNDPATITIASLTSGASVLPTKAEFIGTVSGSTSTGLQLFVSDMVSITVLLCPDGIKLASESDAADVMKEIQSIASARRDLVGLVDIPSGKSVADAKTFADTTAAYNSTYVSCYYPHIKVSDSNISGTDTSAYVPASIGALIALAINDAVAYPWFAAFGVQRGVISDASDVEYNCSKANRDSLADSKINPIINETGIGVYVLGNFTKYSVAQATQSLNIRRLMITIERSINVSAKSLLGEPNDLVTWARFDSMVNALLADVQAKRGITSYLVVCNSSNNTPATIAQKKMIATIKVQPVTSTEIIEVTYQITSNDVNFSE